MSGGYIILVRTVRMAGFEDTKDIWFAHIPDMERAVKAVETATGGAQGTKITVLGTIRHAMPGRFCAFRRGELFGIGRRRFVAKCRVRPCRVV
jgi:hypothetical protein